MINASSLSFRVLTSLIFLYAGIGHLLNPGKILGRLTKSSLYQSIPSQAMFQVLVITSGLIMVTGALFLVFNYKVKLAAMALLLMLIPITLAVQLENLNDLGPFFKNVAISGSLILLIKSKQDENT